MLQFVTSDIGNPQRAQTHRFHGDFMRVRHFLGNFDFNEELFRYSLEIEQLGTQVFATIPGNAEYRPAAGGRRASFVPESRAVIEWTVGDSIVFDQRYRITLEVSDETWEGWQPSADQRGDAHRWAPRDRRLVLTDWYEENGRVREAEYAQAVTAHEEALMAGLDGEATLGRVRRATRWVAEAERARVSAAKLECCEQRQGCPGEWGKLVVGAHPLRRSCETCNQTVFYCLSVAEGRRRHHQRGSVVALDLGAVRAPGDITAAD